MVVCCKLDYRIIKSEKFGNGCYWASIVLLVLVLIIGAAKKGAVRWISIAGFQFQPSEVSKILVVIYLANRLSANAHKIRTFKDSIVIVLPTVPIIALIVTQNRCHAVCGKSEDERTYVNSRRWNNTLVRVSVDGK